MSLSSQIKKLMSGEDLAPEEAASAMARIMSGEAGEAQTAGLLVALAIKGEIGREIENFAREMRAAAAPWPGKTPPVLADTCGTGGDGARTLNISTLSALVLAGLDVPVAKHGNRAVSSSSGSADLLEALGLPLDLSHQQTADCLDRAGICFLFAQAWHPAMKHAAPVRRALGIRTVFNLLGPLTNPAPVTHQVVGVFDRNFMEPVAEALALLDRKGACVVHSEDGLDELSPAAPSHFIRVQDGRIVARGVLQPEDFGLERASADELRVEDAQEALGRTRALLDGRGREAETRTVAMNAALALALTRESEDYRSCAEDCLAALRDGAAARKLDAWIEAAKSVG